MLCRWGSHWHPRPSGGGGRILRVKKIGKRLDDWVITLGSVIDWCWVREESSDFSLGILKDELFWDVKEGRRWEGEEGDEVLWRY